MSLQLGGGIAMGLGYKHNSEAFADLFLFLFSYRHLSEDQLLAMSFGCCGFFGEKALSKWKKSSYYHSLKTLWEEMKDQIIHRSTLRLDHIRPFNHPVRRLVYLEKLLQDPYLVHLWSRIDLNWNYYVTSGNIHVKTANKLRQELIDLLPTYENDYWNHHYTFEEEAKTVFLPLVGEDLKSEIIINTILPMIYTGITANSDMLAWRAFNLFYQSFKPLQARKTKYLVHRFFGNTAKEKLLNTSQLEQGAYQLHKDFCIHFEASCEGCPFVEKMQKNEEFQNYSN